MNAKEIGEFLKGIELFEDLDEGERALLVSKTRVEIVSRRAPSFSSRTSPANACS